MSTTRYCQTCGKSKMMICQNANDYSQRKPCLACPKCETSTAILIECPLCKKWISSTNYNIHVMKWCAKNTCQTPFSFQNNTLGIEFQNTPTDEDLKVAFLLACGADMENFVHVKNQNSNKRKRSDDDDDIERPAKKQRMETEIQNLSQKVQPFIEILDMSNGFLPLPIEELEFENPVFVSPIVSPIVSPMQEKRLPTLSEQYMINCLDAVSKIRSLSDRNMVFSAMQNILCGNTSYENKTLVELQPFEIPALPKDLENSQEHTHIEDIVNNNQEKTNSGFEINTTNLEWMLDDPF